MDRLLKLTVTTPLPCAIATAHGKDWLRASSNGFFVVRLGHCTRRNVNISSVFLFSHVYGTQINTSNSYIS